MRLEQWKSAQAVVWGSANWQAIAASELFPVHEALIQRLCARPGERWLDLATGTGAVALRAARAGAEVTAQDLAPELIETARRIAGHEGLSVRFDVGDAERLAYPDAGFHVVSSAHGVVFAVDHVAVARELSRVCRPGGRLGITFWLPNPELAALMDRFGYRRPEGADSPRDWSRPEYVTKLLGRDFELDFSEEVCQWTGDSGEQIWELTVRSDGPAKSGLAAMSQADQDDLHQDWVAYFERHRGENGISAPRPYLLTFGRRRGRQV
jgi:ubiquinone/menaquinone biosynthesis C-methylase UbiE